MTLRRATWLAFPVVLLAVFLFVSCDSWQVGSPMSNDAPASLTVTLMPNGERLPPPGTVAEDSDRSAYGCYLASRPYTDQVQYHSRYLHYPTGIVEAANGETQRVIYRLRGRRSDQYEDTYARFAHCIIPDADGAMALVLRDVIRAGEVSAVRNVLLSGSETESCSLVVEVETCFSPESFWNRSCPVEKYSIGCASSGKHKEISGPFPDSIELVR